MPAKRPTAYPFRPAILAAAVMAALMPATATRAAELPEPRLVRDFAAGSYAYDFNPENLRVFGDLLYFSGYDPVHGNEPWVSDGSAAGTYRLADLCPGPCSSYPTSFVPAGEAIVFYSIANQVLYSYRQGRFEELLSRVNHLYGYQQLGALMYYDVEQRSTHLHFRTDGTRAGTWPTTDLCAEDQNGACAVFPTRFTNAGGAIYSSYGGRLWRLRAEGEKEALADLPAASGFTHLGNNRVVFTGCTSLTSSFACTAWVSDGSPAGTRNLESAGDPALTLSPNSWAAWRGRAYFVNGADEMVSTDGSPEGTRREPLWSGPDLRSFAVTAEAFYYDLQEVSGKRQLRGRFADGSDRRLLETYERAEPRGGLGNRLFIEYPSATGRPRLAVVSANGLTDLAEITSSSPGVTFQGLHYFGLDPSGDASSALWRSDGSLAGTQIAVAPAAAARNSYVTSVATGGALLSLPSTGGAYRIDLETLAATSINDQRLDLLGVAPNGFYVRELDLVPARLSFLDPSGIRLLAETSPVGQKTAADGRFYATDTGPGQRLWESDGTAAGTHVLFDLSPGWTPPCGPRLCFEYQPSRITPSGSKVYFTNTAADPAGGVLQLWAWQRAQAAPLPLRQFDNVSKSLALAGNRLLFVAPTGGTGNGYSFWESDGSVAGTVPRVPLPAGSGAGQLAATGNRFFFEAIYSGSESILWVSDFTPEGTLPLTGRLDSTVQQVIAAGDHLFFTGRPSSELGTELGFTDGTPAGTRFFDLAPGPDSSYPSEFFLLADQRLVFSASSPETGLELWISDGTDAGTYRLTDLNPGNAASTPGNFTQVGERLFFEANDGVVGRELWVLELPPARPSCPTDRLCLAGGRFEVKVTVATAEQTFVGQRVLATAESGVFSFFSPDNWELQVKVLDGCAINQAFWVYAAAATDQPYTLTVLDRASGLVRTFASPAGPARPILDSAAFPTCAAAPVPAAFSAASASAPAARRCADDPTTLCLGPGGRYRVRLSWQTAAASGPALPVPDGSADSGLFTFFSPSNWEMMVKVLDGCGINGKRWVFAAGTTDVGWTLTVEDRQQGLVKTYENPLGMPSATITDDHAFPCN